jgi:hypothetical protein
MFKPGLILYIILDINYIINIIDNIISNINNNNNNIKYYSLNLLNFWFFVIFLV